MKILLIGNYLPDEQESMQRFADLLIDALKNYNHQVRLIRPGVILNREQSSFEDAGKGKWLGYLDKFILFPWRLKKNARWADVVHVCDHSNAFYIHFLRRKSHIITCHDVIAIRSALNASDITIKRSGRILQSLILQGLKKAAHFACVSENTRKQLIEIVKIESEKTAVIYNGLNYPFYRLSNEEAKGILTANSLSSSLKEMSTSSFLLHVGGNQPYKNRLGVLRIYLQLYTARKNDLPRLVLVGKPWTEEMREFVTKNNLQDHVVEIQNCSNEEMRALYSLARVFVFPSLAEGFGWPVIEAQACGCPVLTSNFAPLTEIGGDAAIYCDPRDEKKAASQLELLLNESEEVRKKRVEAGLKNIKRFSPQTMIEGYLALYQKAIDT